MPNRAESWPPAPPPAVLDAIRKRLSPHAAERMDALRALRMTAIHADHAITAWLADTVGTRARFQVLMLIWATPGSGVAYKDIAATLGVSRATISGLMAGLERDGLVKSTGCRDDGRVLLASLTARGRALLEKAIAASEVQLETALADLSSEELATLRGLLHRVKLGFQAAGRRSA